MNYTDSVPCFDLFGGVGHHVHGFLVWQLKQAFEGKRRLGLSDVLFLNGHI